MSYETVLFRMREGFERQAGCLVDDASDTGIKFKLLASELARLEELLDFYKKQLFPDTAEGEFLLKHGALRGVVPKPAAPSRGTAVFSCKASAGEAIPIPAGTICGSSKGGGLLFRTTADAEIPKGSTTAGAAVESMETGAAANLAPHLLDTLITPVPGVSGVDNLQRLDGGADPESQESFRRRVIESCSQISNGANLAYYEQFARSLSGVQSARAVYTAGSSSQVFLYVENLTRTLSPVIVADLQKQVEQIREAGVRVIVRRPALKRIRPELSIQVDNLANKHTYALEVEAELERATQELGIGERWSPARIAARLLALPGIQDVTITSPAAPVETAAGEIAHLNGAVVTVEGA